MGAIRTQEPLERPQNSPKFCDFPSIQSNLKNIVIFCAQQVIYIFNLARNRVKSTTKENHCFSSRNSLLR